MSRLRQFGAFWYDFIVGDDWTIAVGVVIVLIVVTVAANRGWHLWWLLPASVAVLLGASLRQATRPKS